MPKSRTLTNGVPSGRRVTNRFAGLMSRWIIPAACASATPSIAWSKRSAVSRSGSGPRSSSKSDRSFPSKSSITMYGAPSCVPTSVTRATCSPRRRTVARASRKNRLAASPSARWGRSNFTATRCSSPTCRAATTTPTPPWPSTCSTWYFPSMRVPDSGSCATGRMIPALAAGGPDSVGRQTLPRQGSADGQSLGRKQRFRGPTHVKMFSQSFWIWGWVVHSESNWIHSSPQTTPRPSPRS
jgi:hypothetical protein